MRLFVSYSRGDATVVGRLVRSLEELGYDVWVDIDDIQGSEQWRASIVEGVQRADAVVLVVSPRSVASPHVEREITVSAEERRPIVPFVVEPTELTGSIRYELAGVQSVALAGRSLEAAVAELDAELRALAHPPVPRPMALGRSGRRGRRSAGRSRSLGPVLTVGVVGLAALLGLALVGEDPPAEAGADTTTPTTGSTVAREAPPIELDATVWFTGFEIAVRSARHDAAEGLVVLDTTFTNTGRAPANPLDLLVDDVSALAWEGRRAAPFCSCTWLAGGASVAAEVSFDVDDTFDIEGAEWMFGGVDDHRAVIPLDGSEASSDRPEVLAVAGVVDDGAGTTFTIDRVEVVPAFCRGLADGITYVPARASDASVVVWGTALTTDPAPGGIGFGEAHLVLPDGSVIGSTSLPGGVILLLHANQPEADVGICMNVPDIGPGEHRFVVKATGVEPDPAGLEFRL